ncbi:MAG: winged helix-turn-helix domain-containing protein [Sphingomonadales bacterium]|nr:winged helix-turn-helix domain-containing protein [Sphingomonadales bacterium]
MADKRRQKYEPKHMRLYKTMTDSLAWQHLSGNAMKVLLALVARDDGKRNGKIGFSCREASGVTGLSSRTCWRCFAELQEKGFIVCTQAGGFSRKVSHAALWRYTWAAWPEGRKGPTRDFEKWKPDGNSRLKFLSVTDANFAGNLETPGEPVAKNSTGNLETPQDSDVSNFAETTTLISYHGDPHGDPVSDQRKRAETTSRPDREFRLGDEVADLRLLTTAHLDEFGPGSQSRLAARIDCPPGTFSKFINGRNLPVEYRRPLAAALMEASHA